MLVDDGAAEAELALVKDDRLARGDGSLGLLEMDFKAVGRRGDGASLIGLAIADFGRAGQGEPGLFGDPGGV